MRVWLVALLVGCGAPDADGDGVGRGHDCDDDNVDVLPNAPEVCDGIDNDCDGAVDQDDDDLVGGGGVYFADGDGDGFGGAPLGPRCTPPAGAVTNDRDCDDARADVRPGVPELCNGVDDDCDRAIDDADDGLDPQVVPRWYRDIDGDGFGSAADFRYACAPPEGYVVNGTDCDDTPGASDRYPGAPEICDGKDNDCDIDEGVLVDDEDPDVDLSTQRTWYADDDGDGQGAGPPRLACSQPEGWVAGAEDCDDDDADNFTGNVEVCDGGDNDCDGLVDAGEWWDDAWPYRVLVDVDATRDVTAPPVAVDLDLGAALDTLGDPSGLDPDSLRVVVQTCDGGQAEVPFEWLDAHRRLLARGAASDPVGDTAGALVFRFDTDGLSSTDEVLPAGEPVTVAVYFGSMNRGPAVSAPVWTSALTATATGDTVTLTNDATTLTLDSAQGGLASALGRVGGPSTIGAQTGNVFGNGVYFGEAGGGGSWASAVTVAGAATVTHAGPVVAIAESTGSVANTWGGFRYTYTWLMFADRPEVYAKVTYTLDQPSNVGPQGTYWTAAVRPWQIDNQALVGAGSVATRDTPGFTWVHGSYTGQAEGIWLGWRVDPLAIGSPTTTGDGRYLALSGQDVDPDPPANEAALPAGTVILAGSVVMAWPHAGTEADTSAAWLALQAAVTPTVGPAQAHP